MSKRTLLIDDLRNMGTTFVARNYLDGIGLLKDQHPIDVLYLDHDLGDFKDGREYTGYDVICWLEQNPQYLPGQIVVVSRNPVGVERINSVIERLYKDGMVDG